MRGIIRLFIFIWIYLIHMIPFLFMGMLKGFTLSRASLAIQKWCISINTYCGLSISQKGTIPPSGTLLLCNHRSYIDIFILGQYMPCSFLAMKKLLKWPIIGCSAKKGKLIIVDRANKESRKASRQIIINYLKKGITVIVFPEGTTSKGPGILPLHKGIFQVAAEHSITVVPIALHYEHPEMAWVDDDSLLGHFIKRFNKKNISGTITFGKSLCENNADKLYNEITDWFKKYLLI